MPPRKLTLLATLCLLLAAPLVLAQQQTFRQYGSADGLTNLNVRCLLQDRTGFLWVGTDNGLFRFEGASFREYSHADGLPSTEIHGIAESPSGELWVATPEGLVHLSGGGFVRQHLGILRDDAPIEALAFDPSGTLYLQHPRGILRGAPQPSGFDFQPLLTGSVHGMYLHGDTLFAGLAGDLIRIRGNHAESFGLARGLPPDEWRSMVADSSGALWVRSLTRLFQLPAGAPRFLDLTAAIPHAEEPALSTDTHGRIYVATMSGAVVLDGPRSLLMDEKHGLPGQSVGVMLVDRDESLWMGLNGGGLARRLGHGDWLSWKHQDGLLHNSVWAIHQDRLGQTWIGTSAGLNLLDPNGIVRKSWTPRNGLAGDRVLDIQEADRGDIFIAGDPQGLTQLSHDGRLLRAYGPAQDLVDRISALARDRDGRLWLVGSGGCERSSTSVNDTSGERLSFDHITIPGVPPVTQFRDIAIDPTGIVWIASNHGLLRFDGVSWRVFTRRDGLELTDIDSLALHNGEVWLTYRDAIGISRVRFTNGRLSSTLISTRDGLSSNAVYSLAFDKQGALWAGTDKGVNLFEQGRWQHFGSEDGLVWDDTDTRAIDIDSSGNVWIGTSGGVSRYTRSHDAATAAAPRIVMTTARGLDRAYNLDTEPTLSYSSRALTLQYAALDFTNPRIRFRYRVVGYENAWMETVGRSVQLAALPAGRYAFEVEARSADGAWSPIPARFAFTIETPWWQSWAFYTLAALLLVAVARVLWQRRVRKLIAQREHLQHIVDEQTAELRKRNQQMEQLAYRDQLTGLPNRRAFADDLRRRIGQTERTGIGFVLLLIDLDRFKQVNDTCGHDAGDAVLQTIAARLQSAVRNCDTVARLGGDEFAILLHSDADTLTAARETETVEIICRRILSSAQRAIPFRRRTLSVGCSIGIALFASDAPTEERLYKTADVALYQAKNSGRNTFCWYRTLPPLPDSGAIPIARDLNSPRPPARESGAAILVPEALTA
jgi:diguanylate cyclase (GGDEF)-like protein